MTEMSTLILKALTAEGYNIDFNQIKNFEVLGLIAKDYLTGEEIEYSATEYGIKFDYDNNTYRIEAIDEYSLERQLCVIARAGMHNQLVSEEEKTDNYYFQLPNAYEILKEALSKTLKIKNKKHSRTYTDAKGEETKGYKFDGYFTLKNNKAKEKTIQKSLKEYEKTNKLIR